MKKRIVQAIAASLIGVGSAAAGAAPAFAGSVPSGCSVSVLYIQGTSNVRGKCGTAAAGSYYRLYITCDRTDPYGYVTQYTRYSSWVWQTNTNTYSMVGCDNWDRFHNQDTSWGAQVS